ncbi:predicted protein, partial [Nematostella vectensis]
MDLVILIEGSDNTKPQDFEQIKEVVKTIYRGFPVSRDGTHVGVAIYGDDTNIVFDPKTYYTVGEMDNAVDSAPYPGGLSNAGSALSDVKTKIFDKSRRPELFLTQGRAGIPHVLVVISGGKSDDDVIGPARSLRDAGVLVVGLALGKAADFSL